MEIRDHLKEILEAIILIENNRDNIDYTDIRAMISECLDILPAEKILKVGKNINVQGNVHEIAVKEELRGEAVNDVGGLERDLNKTDSMIEDIDELKSQELKNKCLSKLAHQIRKYLINKRISYEDLFNMLILTGPSDYIGYAKDVLSIKDADKTIEYLVAF